MIVVVGRVRTHAEKRADFVRVAPADVGFHTVASTRSLEDVVRG